MLLLLCFILERRQSGDPGDTEMGSRSVRAKDRLGREDKAFEHKGSLLSVPPSELPTATFTGSVHSGMETLLGVGGRFPRCRL